MDDMENSQGSSAMQESGEYRVTRHKGGGPDAKDAKVIYSHLDEGPAMRAYQRHGTGPGPLIGGRWPNLHRQLQARTA
jgi:hypothetical protein